MEEELVIKPYEIGGIYRDDDASRMVLELSAKLEADKAILEKNNSKENQIAYLRNEYTYYWLKFDYYNLRSLVSKIDESDTENGWFIWLKDYDLHLAETHGTVDDENTAVYDKYFDRLVPFLTHAGSQTNEAIFCYRNERYFACVCALFPFIESVERKINAFDPTEVFNMSKQLRNRQTDLVVSFNQDYFKTFEQRMNDFLHKHFYAKSVESDPEPKQINRNRILHGIFTREVSKTDCLKLFVLANSLLQFNDWLNCYRKMKEISSSIDKLK